MENQNSGKSHIEANRHKRKTIKQTSVMASERKDLVFKAEHKRQEAKEDRAASDAKRDEARILLTQINASKGRLDTWRKMKTCQGAFDVLLVAEEERVRTLEDGRRAILAEADAIGKRAYKAEQAALQLDERASKL